MPLPAPARCQAILSVLWLPLQDISAHCLGSSVSTPGLSCLIRWSHCHMKVCVIHLNFLYLDNWQLPHRDYRSHKSNEAFLDSSSLQWNWIQKAVLTLNWPHFGCTTTTCSSKLLCCTLHSGPQKTRDWHLVRLWQTCPSCTPSHSFAFMSYGWS